jgi:hypothetical protein
LILSLATLCAANARASAVVGEPRPRVAIESALIVWNPATRIQHTLLAARFEEVRGPFTWWIPFPSPVETSVLTEDLSMVLPSLLTAYRARTPRWELPSLGKGRPRDAIVFGGAGGGIDVSTHVLGSTESIGAMLEQHERAEDLALGDYLGRYTGKDWHAVVVRADPGVATWTSPHLYFRFETNRPWYPYREPAYPDLDTSEDSSRLLRVTVVTTEQVAVQHGRSVPTMAYAWLAYEPKHAEVRSALGRTGSEMALDESARLWLASFEDRHAIRPGDDDWTFARMGDVPKDGLPGTVGDETKEGLSFEPLGEPEGRRGQDGGAEGAGVGEAEAGVPRGTEMTLRARGKGSWVVFGVMVLLGLGIAGWLWWEGER